jgi:hypothetical protein
MTSDGKAPFICTGYENAGSPLRKALGIEIVADQEGGSIEGSGDILFDVSESWICRYRPQNQPKGMSGATLSRLGKWRNLKVEKAPMLRRCISTLVLIGFVAGQLVAVPHAHAGLSPEAQRKHDAQPHVHVGHSHGHSHSHGGHSHDHAGDRPSPTKSVPPPKGTEHDANAVYLPGGASATVTVRQQRTSESVRSLLAANDGLNGASPHLPQPAAAAPIRPPDVRAASSKVFLSLRNLRI